MYFKVIGITFVQDSDGHIEAELARGITSREIGEIIHQHCLDYDAFMVKLDSTF